MNSEDFPVQCSIDGGPPVDCASPYVINTTTLSWGEHTITYTVTIDGIVRGRATQAFTVLEEVIIEFRDAAYSVVEDDQFYDVTIVKQGEPGENITVGIFPRDETAWFPSDFSAAGQVTFFLGGPDEIMTRLQVEADAVFEANETLLLVLDLSPASISSGGRLGARNKSRVTIINDDTVQVMFNQLSVETDEFSEARFSVTFDPQETEIPITFLVETIDLSPPDASARIDYWPLRTNVTLSELTARENLAVDIIQDNITEITERFEVRIIIPEETQRLGVSLGNPAVLTIGIIDDDTGGLEIECFTNVTGDILSGRTIQLFFEANQDDVTFQCRLDDGNNRPFVACTSPITFTNVDFSEMVTVTVEGTTLLQFPADSDTVTKPVFFAMGGLQVVGAGALAVQLDATRTATYRCRLNNGEFVDCIDGQEFTGLPAGEYTLFIEATAVENPNEAAYDTVGPVLLAAGANATISEVIGTCFGSQRIHCDNVTNENCQCVATWRTRGDRVEFKLVAQTQGWAGIGFSANNIMPISDIIVGAASDTAFFVDDRYAGSRNEPPHETVQNVYNTFASFVNGVTTVQFSRNKVTGDKNDLTLSVCRYLLFAWSGNADIATGVIQFHGSANQAVSRTLLCFPAPSLCPDRFVCPDPGALVNGNSSFTDRTEGSIVTYTCNPGFELEGNSTQICELTTNGPFWSFTRPTCRPLVCGDPGMPENGGTIVSSDSVGLTAIHFCNDGYILDGVSQRTCLTNSSWSDSLPTCIIVDGGEPGTPGNGTISGTLANVNASSKNQDLYTIIFISFFCLIPLYYTSTI